MEIVKYLQSLLTQRYLSVPVVLPLSIAKHQKDGRDANKSKGAGSGT